MADRYISEKALIDNIAKIEDLRTLSTKTVGIAISATPAADVVEVVRCKDCKCYKEYLYHSTKEPTGWGKCTKIEMDIDLASNDFCSYGERSDT